MDPLELKAQRIAIAVHVIAGIVAGYVSLFFSRFWYALAPTIIILLVVGFVTQKTFGKGKDRKWWLGNGVAMYIMIWLLSWIVFFNLVPLPGKII